MLDLYLRSMQAMVLVIMEVKDDIVVNLDSNDVRSDWSKVDFGRNVCAH